VPTLGRVYVGRVDTRYAVCQEKGVKRRIGGRVMAEDRPLTVVASRSHGNKRLEHYLRRLAETFPAMERRGVGSSLKLCLLADGKADLYPRLGPTSEWDIAAAQAVLDAAGGTVRLLDGRPMRYNKKNLLNPDFVAVADAAFPWADRLPVV